jgi:hypothetical protein
MSCKTLAVKHPTGMCKKYLSVCLQSSQTFFDREIRIQTMNQGGDNRNVGGIRFSATHRVQEREFTTFSGWFESEYCAVSRRSL